MKPSDMFEEVCELEAQAFAFWENLLEDRIWLTRDDREIPVSEMSQAHLTNTIHFLQRNPGFPLRELWIEALQEELNRRQT